MMPSGGGKVQIKRGAAARTRGSGSSIYIKYIYIYTHIYIYIYTYKGKKIKCKYSACRGAARQQQFWGVLPAPQYLRRWYPKRKGGGGS
jgi:hypothetical protein